MAKPDPIEEYEPIHIVSRCDIELLADRLLSRGCSTLTTIDPKGRHDLVLASRVLRRLLGSYERSTGRQLSCIMLAGGC